MKINPIPQGFSLRIRRRELIGLGVLALVALSTGVVSTEQLRLDTYYPSPYGVYNTMRSRNDAHLAVNSSGIGNGRVGVGTNAPVANARLDVRGNALVEWMSVGHTNAPTARIDLQNGDLAWANGRSRLQGDQGGSIELGGPGSGASGAPYIDFHYNGTAADYSARISNLNTGIHIAGASGNEINGYIGNACRMISFSFGTTSSCPANWTVSAFATAGGVMYNSPGGVTMDAMPINGQMLCCKLQPF